MVTGLIVAAGRSTRMGGAIDKVLLEVAGAPVLVHSWWRFDECDLVNWIVIVTRAELVDAVSEMGRTFQMQKPFKVVVGGMARQDSVWNGLQAVPNGTEIVAIHDAARPCITEWTIRRTIEVAREKGAAIAAQPIVDTVKESVDGIVINRTLDRSVLWAAQTPQTFQYHIILRAYSIAQEKAITITDDAAACEIIGVPVWLVRSDKPNPKLTVPEDVAYIRGLLADK